MKYLLPSRKKMRFSLWLMLSMLAVGCSNESETQNNDIDVVSTTDGPVDVKKSKLAGLLEGEWLQINYDCNQLGKDCVPLVDQILWSFGENEVIWGRYTHPYKISNDTVFIAGIPHVMSRNFDDTILFHRAGTNDFMQMIKKRAKNRPQ